MKRTVMSTGKRAVLGVILDSDLHLTQSTFKLIDLELLVLPSNTRVLPDVQRRQNCCGAAVGLASYNKKNNTSCIFNQQIL